MKWICFGKKNRQPFRLTREAFEADTLSKPPFTFNYRNYAVCPACLNAVQILGIRTELKNTPDPYAKHTLAEIPELDAIQDEIAYRNCPYSDPESKPKNCRYTNRTPGIISSMVIELFWTQLDRIFYILERDLPFKLSWQAKETILKDFVGYRGWLHPEISLLNVPWMLLYCSNFHSLWKCELKDGDLREKIKILLSTTGFPVWDFVQSITARIPQGRTFGKPSNSLWPKRWIVGLKRKLLPKLFLLMRFFFPRLWK